MERYFKIADEVVDIHNIMNISVYVNEHKERYYFIVDVIDFSAEIYVNTVSREVISSRLYSDIDWKPRIERIRTRKSCRMDDHKVYIKHIYSKLYESEEEFKRAYNNMIDYIESYLTIFYDSIPNFD